MSGLKHMTGDVSRCFVRLMTMVSLPPEPETCWEWNGCRNNDGYGQISINGRPVSAHKWLYEALNGPVPDGLVVRHHCDNPACVNPIHLAVGTQRDNAQDRLLRGRQASRKGHDNGRRVLSERDIRDIRKLSACGVSNKQIAEQYPVNKNHISKIVNGRAWSHVE